MKILISIIFNTLILYAIFYFLGESSDGLVKAGIKVEGGIKAFIFGGVLLGIINATIKPILKILSLPFFFLFFGLSSILINGATLWLLEFFLNDFFKIDGISYKINNGFDFIIAIAIFSILNIIYSLFFNK